MEIPKFLTEMSEQMNNEDNRCTADPIWMVCHDNWLTCADDRGDKEVFLVCGDGEYAEFDTEEEVIEYLIDHCNEWVIEYLSKETNGAEVDELGEYFDIEADCAHWPNGFSVEKICMQKEMKVINAHLTLEGANQFIARKQHDYPKLYTYVYSMYFCNQMKELRGWIKSLTSTELAK